MKSLTSMTNRNILTRMGRKKRGYNAPEGLIKIPNSPFWYIKLGKIFKSTKESDLTRATIILREVQKRLLEEKDRVKGVLGQLKLRYKD